MVPGLAGSGGGATGAAGGAAAGCDAGADEGGGLGWVGGCWVDGGCGEGEVGVAEGARTGGAGVPEGGNAGADAVDGLGSPGDSKPRESRDVNEVDVPEVAVVVGVRDGAGDVASAVVTTSTAAIERDRTWRLVPHGSVAGVASIAAVVSVAGIIEIIAASAS